MSVRNVNTPSIALSREQNQKLFSFLGSKCKALATGVAQLVLADGPGGRRWNHICYGAVSFVMDSNKKSFFIRVFDINAGSCIWEQEMYRNFAYKCPKPFFITFEIDNCQAGLNFSHNEDAKRFSDIIQEKKQKERQKAAKNTINATQNSTAPAREGTGQVAANVSAPVSMKNMAVPPNMPTSAVTEKQQKKKDKKEKKAKSTKGKKTLSKDLISAPTAFSHVKHVGYDSTDGFKPEELDPEIYGVFTRLGFSDNDLRDKEKAQFIYGFLQDHGGMDQLKGEMSDKTTESEPRAASQSSAQSHRPLPKTPGKNAQSSPDKAHRPLPSVPPSSRSPQRGQPSQSPREKTLPNPPSPVQSRPAQIPGRRASASSTHGDRNKPLPDPPSPAQTSQSQFPARRESSSGIHGDRNKPLPDLPSPTETDSVQLPPRRGSSSSLQGVTGSRKQLPPTPVISASQPQAVQNSRQTPVQPKNTDKKSAPLPVPPGANSSPSPPVSPRQQVPVAHQPPAPPPPPPPGLNVTPATPPVAPPPPPTDNVEGGFLSQIREQAKLKLVPSHPAASPASPRDGLLAQIASGTHQLKPVTQSKKESSNFEDSGLANALKNAFDMKFRSTQTKDDAEDYDDDDEDWDDD